MPRVPLVALRCLREPPPAGALIVKAARQRNVSVQVNGAEKLEVEHRNLRPQDADAGQMTGWTHDNGNEGARVRGACELECFGPLVESSFNVVSRPTGIAPS